MAAAGAAAGPVGAAGQGPVSYGPRAGIQLTLGPGSQT